MSQSDKPYTILVAVDYAETGQLALERAFELALDRPSCELHVLHVLPLVVPGLVPELRSVKDEFTTLEEASEELALYVERKVRAFRARRSARERAVRIISHLRLNIPALEIARLAAELEVDLVVVGTHERSSLSRWLRGSVAEVAVRLCPCPVLVVRPRSAFQASSARPGRCSRCLETRKATERRELFCERHREHGRQPRVGSGAGRPARRPSSAARVKA